MQKIFACLALLAAIFLCCSLVSNADEVLSQKPFTITMGQKLGVEGLVFTVDKAEIGYWGAQGKEEVLERFALQFRFRNSDKTKKYDLSRGFNYVLTDDFDNVYNRVEVPPRYDSQSELKTKHFPSMYPQEEYTRVLFFEAPIRKSRNLFFSIDAPDLDIYEPIVVKIPMDQVTVLKTPEDVKLKERDRRLVQVPDQVKIICPGYSGKVKPGERVSLLVKIHGGNVNPNSVFIISPNDVLEDTPPTFQYDIRIPEDHPKGEMTVLVVAKWFYDEEEKILSDSITFNVVPVSKCCDRECRKGN